MLFAGLGSVLDSISAALSCLVYPSGRSAVSFPEQRLVIEPRSVRKVKNCDLGRENAALGQHFQARASK